MESYIKAYYLPETQLEAWLREHNKVIIQSQDIVHVHTLCLIRILALNMVCNFPGIFWEAAGSFGQLDVAYQQEEQAAFNSVD